MLAVQRDQLRLILLESCQDLLLLTQSRFLVLQNPADL